MLEQKPKQIPAIFKGWNNRTEQSYRDKQLTDKIPETLDYQEKNLLMRIDAEKYTDVIQKEVTKILRIKAPYYSSKTREQKEFIY